MASRVVEREVTEAEAEATGSLPGVFSPSVVATGAPPALVSEVTTRLLAEYPTRTATMRQRLTGCLAAVEEDRGSTDALPPAEWQDRGVPYLQFGLGLAVLMTITLGVQRWAGLRLGWGPLVAALRAVVQLSVIAVLLHGVLALPWTVALFVILMLTTASVTSGGRVHELHDGRRAAATGIVVGSAVTVALIFSLRLIAFDTRYLVSVAGIIIGNSMSGATLAGRMFLRTVRDRADEVEGWLALGATPVVAHAEVAREAVRETLLPGIDQTGATGLVTLPGAFVGALFGGASPVEAATFQLVVLLGIMLAQTITALVVVRAASASTTLPLVPVEPPRAAPSESR